MDTYTCLFSIKLKTITYEDQKQTWIKLKELHKKKNYNNLYIKTNKHEKHPLPLYKLYILKHYQFSMFT